jgi:hypothetical protein
MQEKKRNKSDLLPPYRSWARAQLVERVTSLPDYVNNLEKGYQFFTQEELANLRNRYSKGFTWEDIDQELSRKGILLKKGTFRKYIQEGNLPRAVGYRNRENGRVALFPADIISHINFILYFFKVAERTQLVEILELIRKLSPTSTEYESVSCELIDYPSPEAAYNHYVSSDGEDPDIINAIEKAFVTRPGDKRRLLAKLAKGLESHRAHRKEIVSFLKGHTVFNLEIAGPEPATEPDQS